MQRLIRLAAFFFIIGLTGCGPTKWDNLRTAESQNRSEIIAYCDSAQPNPSLCAKARAEKTQLSNTRAQYVREEQEQCERNWARYERKLAGYDRDLADYDRKLAEYDRELDRYDRDKDRNDRDCERKKDRYDRELDRYQQCLDKKSSSTYSFCASPTYPLCAGSYSFPPSKPFRPSKPSEPFCTR